MDEKLRQLLDTCYETVQSNTNCCLRDFSTNPRLLLQWIEKANQQLASLENSIEGYELHTHIGTLFRIYQSPKAIVHLQKALKLSIELDDKKKEQLSYIRLGEAYKYAGKAQAYTCFVTALELANKNNNYALDFVYQHLGKWHLEQKEGVKAKLLFQEALKPRSNTLK
ncbi:hypothetical protein [Shouchella patagoniensis]|uniref:hypothetical protein n=1 Tax=Shouchella patagoniensis TaxID=228576 RepID=UPI000994A531|nr:hypothetical protein [Shouchella patagoniensis]